MNWYHMDWPSGTVQGGQAITYSFWLPGSWDLFAIEVLMKTLNTAGTYVFTAKNAAAASVLSTASFDMVGSLVAATPTPLTLSGVPVAFGVREVLSLTLDSSDVLFDGTGIQIGLLARGH